MKGYDPGPGEPGLQAVFEECLGARESVAREQIIRTLELREVARIDPRLKPAAGRAA